MLKVAFLHDVEMNFIGGAELSNKKIIEKGKALGYKVEYDALQDFEYTKSLIARSDLTILNNLVKCTYELELIDHLVSNHLPYIKWEHDYGLCAKRSIYCLVQPKVKNCCDSGRFHAYRNLYAKARLNVFQSPMHYQYHQKFYGDAVSNHIVLPPPVDVENIINRAKEPNTVTFLGNLNHVKGGNELIDYAIDHPELKFRVFGVNRLRRKLPLNIELCDKVSNEQALLELSKSQYFFFKPRWPEPSGRVAAEAFLSGNTIISNENVGTFSYDFYPENIELAKKEMANSPDFFWESIAKAVKKEVVSDSKFEHVLVYKSYGGLGDQFIALPALNKLKSVSKKVTLAIPKGLINVYKRHTEGFRLLDIKEIDDLDKSQYDKIINLGNYPKSRRFRNIGVIDYVTHHKLKQHALKHYIDAIATLHKDVDNSYEGYPYFKSEVNKAQPYFTVHPGAGFKPKWWPTERYVELIQLLLNRFKNLNCVVILGPNDPDKSNFENIDRVNLETGNLDAVENRLKGSSFHIGNDSGITHFAGVFNIPFVSFHGLTGPGSWSALSEQREVIWGKPGNCNIKCKYDIAINCEHRNCLTSITVNRALGAVYKLIQKSGIMNTGREKLIFNPEYTVASEENGFIIRSKDKELFLEFQDEQERQCFVDLVQNDIYRDDIFTKNLQILVDTLVDEGIVFSLAYD